MFLCPQYPVEVFTLSSQCATSGYSRFYALNTGRSFPLSCLPGPWNPLRASMPLTPGGWLSKIFDPTEIDFAPLTFMEDFAPKGWTVGPNFLRAAIRTVRS